MHGSKENDFPGFALECIKYIATAESFCWEPNQYLWTVSTGSSQQRVELRKTGRKSGKRGLEAKFLHKKKHRYNWLHKRRGRCRAEWLASAAAAFYQDLMKRKMTPVAEREVRWGEGRKRGVWGFRASWGRAVQQARMSCPSFCH